MAGLSGGYIHLSRWFRANLAEFVFAGSYTYPDPSFRGKAGCLSSTIRRRVFLLTILVSRSRLEAGIADGIIADLIALPEMDVPPFLSLGGFCAGFAIPQRFWMRVGYGLANMGVAGAVGLPGDWTVGGSYIHWWEDPKDTGVRLGVSRTWR